MPAQRLSFRVRLLLVCSQAINALCCGGDPDESLSARAHRERWPKGEARIDSLLRDPGHCAKVYRSQLARAAERQEPAA
jgi:hypothetical protein